MKAINKCPICSSTELSSAYSAQSTQKQDNLIWSVTECSVCSHGFINPQPSWEELAPYYNSSYQPYGSSHGFELNDEEEVALAKQVGRFRHIPIPSNKRILDVGCGGGRFLRICKKLGAIELGIEPSKIAAERARADGLNIFEGTLESYVEQISKGIDFDIITASHVVEHLPDPVETLKAMKQVLAPGGFIWIVVPNAAYPISRALKGKYFSTDLPRHLMQFTPSSIAEAGRQAGLQVRLQITESLPRVVLGSFKQYLRYKLNIPHFISKRFFILNPIAKWYARHLDENVSGEAIITEFVATESAQ